MATYLENYLKLNAVVVLVKIWTTQRLHSHWNSKELYCQWLYHLCSKSR